MKNPATKISLLILFGSFLLQSCGSGEAKKTDASGKDSTASATVSSENDKTKTVEVISMTPQLFNSYIDIQGKVDATENVSLNAEMPGTISKINVSLGQEVSTGQVLAEMDSKALQQGMAELQSGMELANTMYEKQKNLWEQKIGTEMQFLQAKNQKESLEKKMATMQEQLRMSKIISPINGIVDAIDIKLGQATMPGMPAIRVVNMSSLEVKGEVAESYLAKVKNGNDVVVILPDLQDTIKTKISYAAKVISPLNRTFTVTTKLEGKHDYHPNQIAIIKIIDYANPKAFVVPMNSIQRAQEGDFVFISENNKAKKTKVKVGRTYNGKAEILEGLKEGDKFISKGFQELNEGETIKM
jgi:RND family efflux transporter MFP subunit